MQRRIFTPADEAQLYRELVELLCRERSSDIWEWCRRNLHLRTGRWQPERAALLRPWYEIAAARLSGRERKGDPAAVRCEQIYLVIASQLAKTTMGHAILAWLLAEHPREIAWYGTRGKDLTRMRRRAMVPLIERTACLEQLLPRSLDAREKAMSGDLLSVGGSLVYLLIANLIDDLRSLPLPMIILEEFDQLADDIDGQGDPIDLALVRQRTMPHDRLLLGSTSPSRIAGHGWRRLCSGSHERPLVLCPDCLGADFLNDAQVISSTEHTLAHYPAPVILKERLARWACRHCGCLHNAEALRAMVRECERSMRWIAGTWTQPDEHPDGLWTPAAECDGNGRLLSVEPVTSIIRTGWANALYSRDVTLDSFAAGMSDNLLRGTEAKKRTWTNTEAARPWTSVFTATKVEDIGEASCRDYAHGSCPVEPYLLILVFDQQGNQAGRYWFPYTLRAWLPGGESWLVSAGKVQSEADRDLLEERLWPVGGVQRPCDLAVIDSANPNYRQQAYLWAAEDTARRICLRGDVRLAPGETWKQVPPADPRKPGKTSRPAGVREYRIHPHFWRGELHEAMLGRGPQPWHLPADPPKSYLRSLNAEERQVQTRRVTGGGYEEVVVWAPRITTATDERVNIRTDEHWADCEKMQLATADIVGLLAANPHDPIPTAEEPAAETADTEDYFAGVW